MFPLEDFGETLNRIAGILRELQVRFFVTGGAAISAYVEPRQTFDIDLVVDHVALSACLPAFLSIMTAHNYLLNEETVRDAVRSGRQFQLIDKQSVLKIAFYPRELIGGELGRAVETDLVAGVRIPISSRADLAVFKLVWVHKGSHKSRRDIRRILQWGTHPATAAAREFAAQLSLLPLLDEVLAEPDEIDA